MAPPAPEWIALVPAPSWNWNSRGSVLAKTLPPPNTSTKVFCHGRYSNVVVVTTGPGATCLLLVVGLFVGIGVPIEQAPSEPPEPVEIWRTVFAVVVVTVYVPDGCPVNVTFSDMPGLALAG